MIPISLIADQHVRAETYGKLKEKLGKKAWKLSILCGVPVALVCAGPCPDEGGGGGGAVSTEVWESQEGVLARYRAFPPEVRAQNAHSSRRCPEWELGKERAKLARVRQAGALVPWDAALDGITAGEARALLESIDAAMAAASARMEALGQLDDGDNDNGMNDDDGRLELQDILPDASDAIVPVGHGVQYIGGGSSSGHLPQVTPAGDGINECADHDQYSTGVGGSFIYQCRQLLSAVLGR